MAAAGYVFLTFSIKFDYVQSHRAAATKWLIGNNRVRDKLSDVIAPKEFVSLICDEEQHAVDRRIIFCPEHDMYYNTWHRRRKVIPLCTSRIRYMARSRTA